jgi:hypothetical protein
MMEKHRRRGSRVALVALVGILGAVAVAAVILGGLGPSGTQGQSTVAPTGPRPSASSSASSRPNDTVDPKVVDRGWVAEPITQDADVYMRVALEAAATFDTRRATRDEWLSWLGTWLTPSPLYEDPQDALDQMAGYKAELAQTVVPPQSQWDDLARNDGHVSARVDGQIEYLDQPEATQKHVRTATANVVMTYTQTGDGTGGEASYDQTVRVSVQVVCGGTSIPTPDSGQRAGDCKVVRFFDAAVG